MDAKLLLGPASPDARRQLSSELDAVREEMANVVGELGSPLDALVQSRIQRAGRPIRAAMVLAAGYNGQDEEPQYRVYLASALEMLNVALDVHQILVHTTSADSLDQEAVEQRSFIGSTILAGDFCFSHAAQLAAKTQNPTIVSLFAEALQDASARQLQTMLTNKNGLPSDFLDDRTDILLHYGATAALELSGLPDAERSNMLALVELTIDLMTTVVANEEVGDVVVEPQVERQADLVQIVNDALAQTPAAYQLRWQALFEWI